MTNCHLFVLVHGLWGTSSHFNYIESQLNLINENKDFNDRILVYKSKTNEGYKTYDGIDLCGNRVALEIINFIDNFKKENEINNKNDLKITKLSVIGYSLGGLIARYSIGILYYKDFFLINDIKPVNFLSFCTPHIGTLTPGNSLSIKIFNFLVPSLLGNSGKQLFLKDKISSTNTFNDKKSIISLLELMASPTSVFFKALNSFSKRSLYSNVINDKRTSFWTSGISMINPFEILDLNSSLKIDKNGFIYFDSNDENSTSKNFIKLHFIKGYDPIILDVNKPFKISGFIDFNNDSNSKLGNVVGEDLPDDNLNNNNNNNKNISSSPNDYSKFDRFLDFLNRKFKWLIVLFKFSIYLPTWVIWFILHNVFQSSTSSLRANREYKSLNLKELTNGLYKNLDDNDYDEKVLETIDNNKKKIDNFNDDSIITDINTNDNDSLNLRPILSRTLSETYVETKKKLEDNLHDQGDRFLESVYDALISKPLEAQAQNLFEQNIEQDDNESLVSLEDPSSDNKPVLITNLNEISKFSFKVQKTPSASSTSSSTTSLTSLKTPQLNESTKPLLSGDSIEEEDEETVKFRLLEPFKLDLSKQQQTAIQNLNKLDWYKYPIYITKTQHTHAAAIVRHMVDNGSFDEGKVVVKHCIDEVLIL